MTDPDPLITLAASWPDKTGTLSRVFDDTAASYKFFWFLGILTLEIQRGLQQEANPS